MDKFQTWKEFEKELNIAPEQQKEIDLEVKKIEAKIKLRENKNALQK